MSLQGADKLRARLNAIGKTEQVTLDISRQGVREALLLYRHQSYQTGNLGRTIRVGQIGAFQAEIRAGGSAKAGYAAALELGTRPHVIRPKSARVRVAGPFVKGQRGQHRGGVLAWGGPRTRGGRLRVSGGVAASPTHFSAVVHHPGTRAKPYLRPGLQKAAETAGVKRIVSLWNSAA